MSTDYEWVKYTIDNQKKKGLQFTHFIILRPTSPFRNYKTIIRAWKKFEKAKDADSLRAVEVCKQHPGKMWKAAGPFIKPFIIKKILKQPLHNLQFKSLPKMPNKIQILNFKSRCFSLYKTITGKKVIIYTINHEGINYPGT